MLTDGVGEIEEVAEPVDGLEAAGDGNSKHLAVVAVVPDLGLIAEVEDFCTKAQDGENGFLSGVDPLEVLPAVHLDHSVDAAGEEFKDLGLSLVEVSAARSACLDHLLELPIHQIQKMLVR